MQWLSLRIFFVLMHKMAQTQAVEDEIKNLRYKRGQCKGQVTRFENFVIQFEKDEDKDFMQLVARLEKLELAWSNFDEIQSQLELFPSEKSQGQTKVREEFENSFFTVVSRARVLLQEKQNPNNANKLPKHNANVKLAALELPEFRGEFDKWFNFVDTFDALINKNTDLADVQKFYYLQRSLKGEAAQVIEALDITDANYKIAWDLLKQRFEDKRLIVDKHIQSIYDLPEIKRESHAALRKFSDTIQKNVRALKSLGQPVDSWDTLLIFTCVQKLDLTTKREWEATTTKNVFPTVLDFTDFLIKRCQLLEKIDSNGKTQKSSGNTSTNTNTKYERVSSGAHVSTKGLFCSFCKKNHYNNQCEIFFKLPVASRFAEVKRLNLCSNCLRKGHGNKHCNASVCKICNKKHHTLLHRDADAQVDLDLIKNQSVRESNTQANHTDETDIGQRTYSGSIVTQHAMKQEYDQILLSTAIIYIIDNCGKPVQCRALLDGGSQSSFMTLDLYKKLKLKGYKINMPITGINQACTKVNIRTQATIKSIQNNYSDSISFLVIEKITGNLPQISFPADAINIPNVVLADPSFSRASPIDVLLGVEVFWALLCVGQIRTNNDGPIFQKTKLGWVISGRIPQTSVQNFSLFCNLTATITNGDLREDLENFWKIEEVHSKKQFTREERECEEHFVDKHTRDREGRFCVSLPLRDNFEAIGNSENIAIKRFYNLEAKLQRDSELRHFYVEFMKQYEELGHMQQIDKDKSDQTKYPKVYLPHHGVFKETNITTKLRVVFDASAKADNNISLNDILKTGPVIQDELLDIVLRFRLYNFVFTADISKMYRQVNVHEQERDLQRIVWRASPSEELKHYRLSTVTYGTAPASFLAIRALHEAANTYDAMYPKAAEIIRSDFYVDDLMSGSDTIDDAIVLKNQIIKILKGAKFELRKWNSNCRDIISDSDSDTVPEHYILCDKDNTKVLGLLWNANFDILQYAITDSQISSRVTKRVILSTISKIFDPLGLIGPATIRAKILLQRLWQEKTEWDEGVSEEIHTAWVKFRETLKFLNDIKIPRLIAIVDYREIQLHAFCDASELAYGAAVYIRTTDADGQHHVKLLTAKSRVAPLKTISVPRLELCSAILLTRLVKRVHEALKIKMASYYWSDSTITLAWIHSEPNTWKTFVANRITEIHETTDQKQWNHVISENNPADVISRGVSPETLKSCVIWWQGPDWLSKNVEEWPTEGHENYNVETPERRTVKQLNFHLASSDSDIFAKYSSITKLQRVTAYCLRFVDNCKLERTKRETSKLTTEELKKALFILIKIVQHQMFQDELSCLKKKRMISRKSKLLPLAPFLDTNNLIRVGGRIRNSPYSFDKKHPILLPSHIFTELIIKQEHLKLLHAGTQAVLFSLRNKYWLINGKNAIKKVLRQCVTCFKVKPKSLEQPMGQLPAARSTPVRPFYNVGVDFAGPFLIKDGRVRTRMLVKGYLCIFICFITKAVHLELVGDLTAQGFLNALKRFIARRGLCKNIHSDNGTNFVGCNNELKKEFKDILTITSDDAIASYLSQCGITWHFIPAKSPSFGGLWECNVKSAKFHMKRILGNSSLTFEGLYTVITQIEAVMNSRPITPMSSDPNDFLALCPSHFLIGDLLTAVPERDIHDIPVNRLNLYQRLQRMAQHFWRRWSNDYITNLQNRTKWMLQNETKIPIDTLVILKEDNLPPLYWRLGRVIATHPGRDGVSRVVSVKTANGVFRRAVGKICVLPIA